MIEVLDIDQGSPEWYAARLGMVTASEFKTVLAKGKDGGGSATSVTRRTYMLKLAGERLTGEPSESYTNSHMDRGTEWEPEARDAYAFLCDEPITRVGFIKDAEKGAGCSPDALVGAAGGLELKSALPHILLGYFLKGTFPAEHKAQVQGNLWISEREWWEIAIYHPKLKLFRSKVYRDEAYIKELAEAVTQFNEELEDVLARYNEPEGLRDALERSLA